MSRIEAKQSPIFTKTEAFMGWLLNHTAHYPRIERFRLAAQIDGALFAFHESLLRAALSEEQKPYLLEADVQLQKLRTLLRLAVELGYTTSDQFFFASQHTTEIGRLLGGWMRSS
ncbi:MAG: diversity-generating retroelement protein Avd [Anaerolineae bacterium]|nr:diversity-generating retroelement protein Avd [Anaerolineae bacterium]NUQ07214.1 diversity-generating retroelement protein Avd [Anaerolineae bacterium]